MPRKKKLRQRVEDALEDDRGEERREGEPRSRARIAGRSTSPARAGRTVFAAKPMAVARKAGTNGTRPTGSRIQIQRIARNTKLASERTSARREPSRRDIGDAAGHLREADSGQEEDEQPDGEHDRERRPGSAASEQEVLSTGVTGVTGDRRGRGPALESDFVRTTSRANPKHGF